jgi:hypothetical protein
MNGVTQGHSAELTGISRRLGDIERALGRFSNHNVMVDMAGVKGRTGMEILGVAGPINRPKSAANVGGPWYAYVTDTKVGKFAIADGHFVINVATGEELQVKGSGVEHKIYTGTKVWIEFTVKPDMTIDLDTPPEIKFSTNNTDSSSTEWPEDMIKFDTSTPPVQTKAFVVIGEIIEHIATTGDGGFNITLTRIGVTKEFHFTQNLTTNLFLALMTVDGKAVVYPLPFAG